MTALPNLGDAFKLGSMAGKLIENVEDQRDPLERKRLPELHKLCLARGVPEKELYTGRHGGSWNKEDCLKYLRAQLVLPETRKLGRTGDPDIDELDRPQLLRLAHELGIVTNPKTTLSESKLREKCKAKLGAIVDARAGKAAPIEVTNDGDDAAGGGERTADESEEHQQ